MPEAVRPLAVVTGASSGIGFELAKQFVAHDFEVLIAAEGRSIVEAAQALRQNEALVDAVQADLATPEGVNLLNERIGGRPVDALAANAGIGLGGSFFDQDFDDVIKVIDTNITGELALIHTIGRGMRDRGRGRILITGSIAGLMPGTFQAVYNATKAFLDSFSFAIRNELKDTGVTVTCLMPGLTDTDFFERAGQMDTKLGQSEDKADPAKVAEIGFEAMMRGEGDVVAGLKNKLQAAAAAILPESALAQMHRGMAEPGGGKGGS
jgi:short-subunit dehydrogenase